MKDKAHYQEYRYASAENPNGRNGEQLTRLILKRINRLQNIRRVCELGCGNGYFAGLLGAQRYEVTGVDYSESGIRLAKQAYGHYASFYQANINKTLSKELGSDPFDLALAAEVIEHLYRPADLLEAANAILKPGGYLLLTTPYHGYLKNLALSVLNRWDLHLNPFWEGGHIKFFSVKTLSQLVAQHGFKIVDFYFFGRLPFLWKSMICLAQKKDASDPSRD